MPQQGAHLAPVLPASVGDAPPKGLLPAARMANALAPFYIDPITIINVQDGASLIAEPGDEPPHSSGAQQSAWQTTLVRLFTSTWSAQRAPWTPQFVVANDPINDPPPASPVRNAGYQAWLVSVFTPTWSAEPAARIAPLTLPTPGQQPPPLSSVRNARYQAWLVSVFTPTWPAPPGARIAPLTLPRPGTQPPPPSLARSPSHQAWVVSLFTPTWSAQHGGVVAPLTLIYGQQPPRRDPTQRASRSIMAAWQVPGPMAVQHRPVQLVDGPSPPSTVSTTLWLGIGFVL